ncbi:hypothetical protein KDA_69540 [Dictyobacter alpinus]|uniref:Uncharacterized protein n=1 Tax=Dictyobacter alpinus TaxID=2014873 RepID=A0A402BJE8_9CHLR|nr:hypothetical protein [Dictyobacter alpinus]GCE31470.1 hypothetical protein KDA_69540 [Dictyobacter alpinus]
MSTPFGMAGEGQETIRLGMPETIRNSMQMPRIPRASRQIQPKRTTGTQQRNTTGTQVGRPTKRPLPITETHEAPGPVQPHPKRHWLVSLGLGMVLMLVIVFCWQFVAQRTGSFYADWQYGHPRTFQTDAFVGHESVATIPSHFIVVNLNGMIQILELPGGDQTKVQRFQITQLSGANAADVPVTIEFVDPNHTHHPDMLVHIQDAQILLKNEKGTFHVVNH